MADEAGSFVIDANGNAVPNPDDEAMAARHGLKKQDRPPAQAGKKKKEEVTDDAGK